MTFRYNNVYINDTSTITGPTECKGPLSKYFDKSYGDMYFGAPTWEQAEAKIIAESVDIALNKVKKIKSDVDIFISGDLLNQIVASNYAAMHIGIPYLGIYNACATSVEGLLIAANMIEAGQVKTAITTTSSHNSGAEKQFRYPVEYGGPKPTSATYTTTGSVAAFLSNSIKGFKIESATVGEVVDSGIKDAFNMGGVMAISAAKTIYDHLTDTKREPEYYDLILTGDLGIYGKDMLRECMLTEYGIELKNLDDAGSIIYDFQTQEVTAGGSGPACLPLVVYGYIMNQMKKGTFRRILIVATGALMSPAIVNQKLPIPSISHALSLEVVE